MALVYGKLGSAVVAANTDTGLYTVPASTTAVGQFIASNGSSANRTFRMAVITGAGIGSVAAGDYLVYDRVLVPGEVFAITGLTLNAADTILVRSDANGGAPSGVSFHFYGEEQS